MKEYWNEYWEDPWQNLLYYMEIRDMSFQQLAKASGVKQATIEGWRRTPQMMLRARAEYVVRVCDALNVHPKYMLGFKADPKRSREEQLQLGVSEEARIMRAVFGNEDPELDSLPRRERKKRVENKRSKDDTDNQ